jgi:hypothetical protein
MFMEKIENTLGELEKENNYSPAFYSVVREWLNANALHDSRDFKTLLEDLDKTLSELYFYKISLKVSDQNRVAKKVLDTIETHLEIEVAEPEVTLKF